MEKRQVFWKKQGYTEEQTENHLKFERYKSKQSRDRRKRNNEINKELIKKIKDDLLGKEFSLERIKVKVLSIRPSVDGLGFWSEGTFREFRYFSDYNKKDFLKDLN
jgi:hypothetical protein